MLGGFAEIQMLGDRERLSDENFPVGHGMIIYGGTKIGIARCSWFRLRSAVAFCRARVKIYGLPSRIRAAAADQYRDRAAVARRDSPSHAHSFRLPDWNGMTLQINMQQRVLFIHRGRP